MAENENESENAASLRQLGKRLQAGMAKLYPAKPEEIKAVRDAIRRQWQQEQEREAAGGKAKQSPAVQKGEQKPAKSGEKQEQTEPDRKEKSKDKDWGHSY